MSIIDKIVSAAKNQIGTCEPDGDDKYIKVYNEATVQHSEWMLRGALYLLHGL